MVDFPPPDPVCLRSIIKDVHGLFRALTDAGLFDLLAVDVHPDEINRIVDAVEQEAAKCPTS